MVVTLGFPEFTLAVVVGALGAIIYALRILIVMERRVQKIELHIETLANRMIKEELKIETFLASLVTETQSNGIIAEFNVSGEPQALEDKVSLALYRVAQEGLTNVRRHARASRVDVLLDFKPTGVRLKVKDNGVGAAETAGGFGLLGIRERMQLLGGKVEIRTGPGTGFCLSASVPVSAADRPVPPVE